MNRSTGTEWRKSSRSGGGNCVEVASNLSSTVFVRDSKETNGPALAFGPAAWTSFVSQLKAGH